ncbi:MULTISPECIES: hypothetical protein [unclassified Caballeronia]|uniref:hypothetical protein n=1 Tax=unclassified Caballeronia TaxID=2646786 RepID=UPI0020297993|nr:MULTISPECIES: hypothetical protein [unclassified Caballeronia]
MASRDSARPTNELKVFLGRLSGSPLCCRKLQIWCNAVQPSKNQPNILTVRSLIFLIGDLSNALDKNDELILRDAKPPYLAVLAQKLLSDDFEDCDPSMEDARIFFKSRMVPEDRYAVPASPGKLEKAIRYISSYADRSELSVNFPFDLLSVHHCITECCKKFDIGNAGDFAKLYHVFYEAVLRKKWYIPGLLTATGNTQGSRM